MSSSLKKRSKLSLSLLEEVLPKLRPFQREALEFATKGTAYRHYNDNINSNTNKKTQKKSKPVPFEDPSLLGKGRILLADEMGLGKTITALAIASYYESTDWPLLILCPASLRYTWPSEMEKFWPSLPPSTVHVVTGFSDVSWMEKVQKGQVRIVILTYSLLQKRSACAQCLLEQLETFQKNNNSNNNKKKRAQEEEQQQQNNTERTVYFPTIIADESHNLKQRDSQRTQMVLPLLLASRRLLLLSGTPALARPVELYTQLHALAPSLFGKFKDYADQYCAPKKVFAVLRGGRRFPKWDYNGSSNLDELHAKLKHVMVRRLKQNVLDELPPKQRSIIPVTMAPDQKADCKQAMKEVSNSRGDNDPDQDTFETKRALMQAYQTTGIGKAAAVAEYLLDWLEGTCNTEKIVVFAHHRKVLDYIHEALHRHFSRGSQRNDQYHIRIDGQVLPSVRHGLVRQFQSQPQTRVALLSMTAAGVGLTLTAASTVLFAEMHWTPGVLAQSEDRVHRLGQAKTSHIIYCLCQDKNLSLDPILCNMLGRKIRTLLQVVDGASEGRQAFLAKADQPEQLPERQDPAQSGQEELTDFFANLNQCPQRRNTTQKPAVRGSIESFFSRATPVATKSKPVATTPASKLSFDKNPNTPVSVAASRTHSPSKMSYWTCTSSPCDNNHSDGDSRCAMCDKAPLEADFDKQSQEERAARGKQSPPQSAMVEWNCASCTYANRKPRCFGDVYCCDMCGESFSCWEDNNAGRDEPSAGTKSVVTPTPASKNVIRSLSCGTEIINVDEDDKVIALNSCDKMIGLDSPNSQESGLIELLDSPQAKKQRTELRKERNESSFAWVFSVSKNSGRVTIHYKESGSSTNVNFDVHQILSKESVAILGASQQRRNQKQVLPITFDSKILDEVVKAVLHQHTGADKEQSLVRDIQGFVAAYLRLREVEKKTIQDSSATFPPVNLLRAVAQTWMRRNPIGGSGTGRYVGGAKERAHEKQQSGTALLPAERAVLDGSACAWCGSKLSRGHQKADAVYCTQECAEEGRLRRGGKYASLQIRSAMFALEGGKCVLCNVDAHNLFEQILSLQPAERLNRLLDAKWKLPSSSKALDNFLQNPKEGDFWQVDHILAVAEGGGGCGLENLRTLCVPCHHRETEKLRFRLKLLQTPQNAATTLDCHSSGGKKRKQADIRSLFFSANK